MKGRAAFVLGALHVESREGSRGFSSLESSFQVS